LNRTIIVLPLLMLITAISGCAQKELSVRGFANGEIQHVVRLGSTQWRPCPANLPTGCEVAILDGHPQKAGLFTVRFNTTQEFIMPAHSHPKDERVTVIQGRVAVGFGQDASRAAANEFVAGDYYINARDVVHKVWIDADSIVQISGIGPWVVEYVDSAY